MKIAYLANVRFPTERAHSIQISNMCESFSHEGCEVSLFVNRRVSDNEKDSNVSYKVLRLQHGFFIPKLKISYYLSELLFAISFLFSNQQKNFDVIYSRHEWIVWFLSLFLPSQKLVWESHEAKLNFPAQKLLNKGIKTVVISEGIFDEYIKFGIAPQQLLVSHDAIDGSFLGAVESKDVARTRLGLPLEQKIVMYIGGFDGWKGVETFFAAAALLPEIAFVAIGGSSEQTKHFSEKYPNVNFLGQHPYADLKNNQQAADVLVVPNSNKIKLSSHYTSPLKLFAHMASGIPLVLSNIPSIRRITGDSHVTLVEPDNPRALAAGIVSVFDSLGAKIASAQQMVTLARKYTWNERAKRILNTLHVEE